MGAILGSEPITLSRTSVGTRDASGTFVAGTVSTSTIQGSWQPLTGIEAQSLPEAERHKDWQKVYTRSELRPLNQHTGVAGDRLVLDGLTYEVRKVKRFRKIIPHYRAEVVRIQEGGS